MKSSLERLHVIYSIFIKNLDCSLPKKEWIRIDPSINKSVEILIAENILEFNSNRYSVSSKGAAYLIEIEKIKELFMDVKKIKEISKAINETQCQSILKGLPND
jgi:hypothetical protein